MEKVLVLRGGALGDFIVTLPALRSLRERWPRAKIELAGNATAAQLALARGWIDAVHSQHEARWAALYGDAALSPAFAEWLAGFDLVLSYWPDPDGALSRQFPRRAGQRFLAAPAMPARAPAAAHYCEPLRELGIEPREFFVRLAPLTRERVESTLLSAHDHAEGDPVPPLTQRAINTPARIFHGDAAPSPRLDRSSFENPRRGRRGPMRQSADDVHRECEIFRPDARCIVIHPGSGSPRKNWPAENWRRLIDALPGPVSLILGEAETPQWGAWADRYSEGSGGNSEKRLGVKPLHLFLNRPLEELVDCFAQCRLFLGHDSGISHLAAACGARCVLLFGPTEPEVWAPPAPNVRVIRSRSDLAALPVDVVRRAAAEALADQT